MATFKNIQPGDYVTYRAYAGLGRNGPEYKNSTGTAQRLLVFEHHVVVSRGGRFGSPQVVNEANYVSHRSKAPAPRTGPWRDENRPFGG